MKKFLITLLVIVVAALGVVGYGLLANDMAMLTVFSQDQEKMVNTLNAAFEKIQDQDVFNVSYSFDMIQSEDTYSKMEVQLKLMKVDDTWEFISKVKVKAAGEGETSTEEAVMYYKEGVLYAESDGEVVRVGNYSINQALSMAGVQGGIDQLIPDSGDAINLDGDITMTAKITFSLIPFYVGQEYVIETEEGFSVSMKVSTFGNLKEMSMYGEMDGIEVTMVMKYLNGNSSLSFPAELPTE